MSFPPTDHCPQLIESLPETDIEDVVKWQLKTCGWVVCNGCFSSEEVEDIKTSFFSQLIKPEKEATVFRTDEIVNSSRSRASILTMNNRELQNIFHNIFDLQEEASLLSSITNMNYISSSGVLPTKPSFKIFQNFLSSDRCFIGLVNFTNTSRVTLYTNSHDYLSNLLLNIYNTKSNGASPDNNTLNLLIEQEKISVFTPELSAGDVLIFDARLTIKFHYENDCLSKFVSFAPKKDNYSEASTSKRTRYFYSGKTTKLIVEPVILQSVPTIKKNSLCSSIEMINEEDSNKLSKLF